MNSFNAKHEAGGAKPFIYIPELPALSFNAQHEAGGAKHR